jgi:uncharacterized caspase-like protein
VTAHRRPAGARLALVVATSEYRDPALGRLRAPAHDAVALATVLADPRIGGFTVTPVLDRTEREVRLAVTDFLDGRHTDDLVLLYLSCHGLLNPRRELYFAATDTRKSRLAATAVQAQWLSAQLDECRARQQIVILDCCFSGAFARGAKADGDLNLQHLLAEQARGRVVLTASRSTEYSFEGDPVAHGPAAGSVFTTALVEGMRTGAADTDDDGVISVDEVFDYACRQVRAHGSNQTPQRWLLGGEGRLALARRPGTPVSAARASGSQVRPPEPTRIPPMSDRPGRESPPVRLLRPASAWVLLGLVAAVIVLIIVVNTVIAVARLR